MPGWIRSIWRFNYFAFSIAIGIVGFFWSVLWGRPKEEAGYRLRKHWLSHIPPRMGLRIRMEGDPYQGPCLYVGNHIAYLDPVLVLMHVDADVVAKAEISNWPLVGYGAAIVGTIFVRREEKSSRDATARTIQHALSSGLSILVFPEGTTSAGPTTLPFRPRSFDAAFQSGVPVQPIAIIYDSPIVAYVGNDTFIPHFFRLFKMKVITGKIIFGPLLYGPDTCASAKQWIDEQLTISSRTPAHHEPAPKA